LRPTCGTIIAPRSKISGRTVRKLGFDIKNRSSAFDSSQLVGQIDEEIAFINAGLEKLQKVGIVFSQPFSGRRVSLFEPYATVCKTV
jgi:hypothetical protein